MIAWPKSVGLFVTQSAPVIILDYDAIMKLVAPADLIRPVRAAFRDPATAPDRSHYSVACGTQPPGSLLVAPAWREGDFVGVKIASVFTSNGARGLPTVMGQYLMLSAETGETVALLDGRALSLLRAGAVSALAADLMAPKSVKRLLMVGAGALASFLIESHACVRDYDTIQLWARDPAKARRLAEQLERDGVFVEPAVDLEKAARRADVISCATLSDEALIEGGWLAPSCHLDLVGGFRPDMRESDNEAMRSALVVTDSPRAIAECGDLCEPLAARVLARSDILSMSDVCNPGFERPARRQRSVFKAIGSASADLAAAEHILHRAVASHGRRGAPSFLPELVH